MISNNDASLWTTKGETLTDKSAQKEYGLTQAEIVQAIESGKLEYRLNSLYGNPTFKLLRRQIEAFIIEKYGADHLYARQIQTELATVTTEIRSLKRKITQLEKRKEELLALQTKSVT